MKGVIQRYPTGLLALLSIKQDETPQTIAEIVAGSLELMPFYLAERVEVVTAQSLGLSAQANLYLQVPAAESWWLYGVHATAANVTAGSAVKLNCGVADQAQNAFVLGSMDVIGPVSVAGEVYAVAGPCPQPLLLKGGSYIFAGTLVDPGAGTLDLAVRGLIARLNPS